MLALVWCGAVTGASEPRGVAFWSPGLGSSLWLGGPRVVTRHWGASGWSHLLGPGALASPGPLATVPGQALA